MHGGGAGGGTGGHGGFGGHHGGHHGSHGGDAGAVAPGVGGRGRRVEGPRPGRWFGDRGRLAGARSTVLLLAVLVLAVVGLLVTLR